MKQGAQVTVNPIKELKAVEDRLVLIEPDVQFRLALNPLDVQSANIPHAIALIEYILSGLLDAKFTNLQSALFRHVLPAILQAIPSPTIETLKLVLANGLTPEQTTNLDERLRKFFADKTNGFYSKTYAETRSQIIWRLDFILTNDIMRTMFASPTTRLKIADAMNSGKIIIIDASKAILGDDGSEFYQRFFLALILGAAQARSALNPAQKLPVFCYLDECQWVRNDQKLVTILDECRSQRIALILSAFGGSPIFPNKFKYNSTPWFGFVAELLCVKFSMKKKIGCHERGETPHVTPRL